MRSLALVLVVATACASAGDAPAPPGPAAFRGVHTLMLVRSVDGRDRRPKDPLDGLDESLRERGFTTRVVEVGGGREPELAAVERLFDQLANRAAAPRSERMARPVTSAGAGAGTVVANLGVDAVATYHRIERPRGPALLPPASPGFPFTPATPRPAARPTGALVLVDRAGHVATFAWGDAGPIDDPAVPLNAAEAIELLVRTLTGAPPEE